MRVLSVLLTVLMVVGTIPAMSAGPVAANTGNTAGNSVTFHVEQGSQCYDVTALGDGSQSVEEFYDYRNNETHPNQPENWTYSSHGTTSLQENQGSKLLLYNGSEGYSLVVLHDKFALDGGDGSNGSTITFTMSGMADVSWAVQDDTYANDSQNDNWDTDGSVHEIDWMWAENSTDGGAARNVEGETITIEPAFNENASAWGSWPYSDDPANRTESWSLIVADGTEQSLDMGRNVTVSTGSCPDTTDPDAALSASPNPAGNDQEVTFDASNSSDDEGGSGIAEYQWDFDGDGETDVNTSDAKVNHTYGSLGEYNASVKVIDEAGNADVANTTVRVVDKSDENITYVNASTIEVTGDYESVVIETDWYSKTGRASERISIDNVSGTTIISAPETGINGTAIASAAADEDGDGVMDVSKSNPFDYADQIKPYSVNVSVESVTQTGDGTYEVTFGYTNPNDEWLYVADSQYTSGNVSGEPPRKLYSGENTTTVTWTPDSDDERVTWEVDQSNFGLGNVSASTQQAGDVGDGGSDAPDSDAPPTANLTAADTGALSEVFTLDASASTDDEGIERYKYDIDGDGTFEWFGGKMTGIDPWTDLDGPGTYTATVRVWDSEGQTDTDSVTFTIEKRDHTKPEAAIDASDTVEVGQTVTFEATDFTEAPDALAHICWELDGEGTVDGRTWTTSFDEPGEKQITLVLKDRAGNLNEITTTITVVAADGSDESNDGSDNGESNDGDTNPGEGGVTDGDDTDSKTDGVPTADPDEQNDGTDSQSDGTTSAPLTDDDGAGEVVVESMDAKSAPGLEVTETAPASVETPTPDDGFETLSYLNVTDANRATFTVSKAQLNASGTTADAVTLFRYENGSWTAVETAQVDATDDGYEFGANVSDGTYAVGIDRPATDVTDVTVSSERVEPGDSVTVFVTVENDGRADGVREVSLTVGGEVVATQNVSVEAGETKLVSFSHAPDASGVYEVSVDDEATELVVEGIETDTTTTTTTTATTTEDATDEAETSTATTTNDPTGVPGFGVSISLVALVGAALLALRRR